MLKIVKLTTVATMLLAAGLTHASNFDHLRKKIEDQMPGVTIEDIRETPVKGILELKSGKDIVYISDDAKHLFIGMIMDVETKKNLTEVRKDEERGLALKNIQDKDLVIYPAEGKEKASILVFTDPSCPFCQKLHNEVAELNKLGVTVKYALYARAGLASEVGSTIKAAFCEKDKQKAVDKIMSGEAMAAVPLCNPESLQRLEASANAMHVDGTPFIISSKGKSMPGYRPAKELAAELGI
jgi:thiol:disulfide interchange protein DsbC